MLSNPVNLLKGVGEKFAADLNEIGIYTILDLLHYFPYKFNIEEIKPISELIHEDRVTVVGVVIGEPLVTFYGRKKNRMTFNLQVEQATIKVVMFNRAFAKKQFTRGRQVTLSGKWDAYRLQITVDYFKFTIPDKQATIYPVYSVRGDVTIGRLQKAIEQAVNEYSQYIEEFIPEKYLIEYKLPTRKIAIATIHRPQSREELKHARRRIVYEELLLFQLKINLLKKQNRAARIGNALKIDHVKVANFIKQLPFQLTGAQERSVKEILNDLTSDSQMYRLLQGDVGSGKTAVAAISLYGVTTTNMQGALMVPTEILAEQHYESLQEMFADELSVVLLTSSVKGKKRKEILADIKNHDVDIIVGTHSLIQEEVTFNQLGIAIIDEQHRFGVEQRRLLREKGLNPDVLFMTATPIPRTLAITSFGEMDISIIDELPKGRKEIETYWVNDSLTDRVLKFVENKVLNGEQAYIVSPLIEESEAFDYENAVDLYERLVAYYPPHIKLGLLHGRMTIEEKESIMKQFLVNNIHVLVSTTVIEVGVNVPNATIMVIYDAERFGLSQLHQLRGRVGRGQQQSYCILIAEPKTEEGKERMRIIEATTDGFELAEADLKLRGPGNFFGKQQSGLPKFKLADIIHDDRALEIARQDAYDIVFNDRLTTELYEPLRKFLESENMERFD